MNEHADFTAFAELEDEFEAARVAAFESKQRDGRYDPELKATLDEVMDRLAKLRSYWREVGEAQQNGAPGHRAPFSIRVENNTGPVED